MTREQIFRQTAFAVLGAGLLLCAHALWSSPPVIGQIRAKLDNLRQMRRLENDRRREEAAVAWFEKMPDHTPPPLRDIVGRVFPELPAEIRGGEEKNAAAGWTVREAEISLDSAPLHDVGRLLAELWGDGRRPPWRLTGCQIKASEQVPGSGRVTLRLRALEKTVTEEIQ